MNLQTFFTIAAFALGLAGFAWGVYLKGHSNRVRVTDRHDDDIREMQAKIRDLELKEAANSSPLMKQVQDLLSAGLHHPDPEHSRSDALLEKLDNTTLTTAEIPELTALLDDRIRNPRTPAPEAEAARALKAIMPLVVKEAAAVEEVKAGRTEQTEKIKE